eukprot:COSAG05_NODE_223_length_13640_cov_1551.628979_2_plen_40_part_00
MRHTCSLLGSVYNIKHDLVVYMSTRVLEQDPRILGGKSA